MDNAQAVAGVILALTLMVPQAGHAQPEAPGTFKIPFTDSTIKVDGYVQLDTTYDASGRIGDINNYDFASIVAVQPLDGSPAAKEHGKLYSTGRTTRFGAQTTTPTGWGPIGTRIEFDFNGPNGFQGETYTNSVLFRLRHAYGTIGGLLVGQTWTQFLDLASYPDVVDFNGPGSIALVRQPQIRYTHALPSSGATVGLAVENTRNGGVGHLPDVTGRLAKAGDWGTLALSAVTNQYRFDEPNSAVPRSGSKQGFGIALSASFKILGDTVVVHGVGGDGIGRYLFNTAASQFTGTGTDGSFRLWRAYAYHVGYTHVWNSALRSNLVWSQTFFQKNGIDVPVGPVADDESAGTFAANKRIDQAFVNTFWSFAKNAEAGLEYELGRRHTFDGQVGRQNRVTLTVRYGYY